MKINTKMFGFLTKCWIFLLCGSLFREFCFVRSYWWTSNPTCSKEANGPDNLGNNNISED
jgi:hypothetical protein